MTTQVDEATRSALLDAATILRQVILDDRDSAKALISTYRDPTEVGELMNGFGFLALSAVGHLAAMSGTTRLHMLNIILQTIRE